MKLNPDEIEEYLKEFSIDSRAIEKELIDICFYMRGSIDINQAYMLSYHQRKMIWERIEKNIEQTEKSGLALV